MKLPADAFGDRFAIEQLPLPRPASGYAVQQLDTDCVLDRRSGELCPVRTPGLEALFDSFDAAHAAASAWVAAHRMAADEHPLAIVPASFDEQLQRPVLIYGVLCGQP